MSYSEKIYVQARHILADRADKAEMTAQDRRIELCDKFPELENIRTELTKIGVELSKIFLFSGDKQAKITELQSKSERLVRKRREILEKNGYPADAMDVHYTCSACKDTGFIDGRMCSCHRQLLKDLMKGEVSMFAPLDKFTFDNFNLEYYSCEKLENEIVPRERAEKVFDASRRYAQNFTLSSRNLLFIGGTGLGKTHLSLAIANVVINRGYSVCYGTSQNIVSDIRMEQYTRRDDYYYTKDMVLSCDLLVLDDLGTETDDQYNVAIINNIINSRIMSAKPTIISTNYSLRTLENRYDKRITSRLTGEYLSLYLFGNDIRNM